MDSSSELGWFAQFCTRLFGPALRSVFGPVNGWLETHYLPWAPLCAMGLFLGTMAWVWSLRSEYANVDAPYKGFIYDLRLWTTLCLLPYIFVYLYFTKWR